MTTHHAPSPEPSASLQASLPAQLPSPLPVPERARTLDLGQSFTQLLFRASMLTRKREEEAQAARAAQQELLGALVEVDDALASLGLDPELVHLGRGAGIEATRRRLLGRLAKAGVRPMRLEGLTADPALTEIVGTEARPGVAPETVVQTVVTGFFWGDEVLRRAQVVVAAPEAEVVSEAVAQYVEAVLAPDPDSDLDQDPEPKPDEPAGSDADGLETTKPDTAEPEAVALEAAEPEPDPATSASPAGPKASPVRARRARTGGGTRRKRKKN